jgi:hypothetical protein
METKVDFEHNKRKPITVEDYLEGREGGLKA